MGVPIPAGSVVTVQVGDAQTTASLNPNDVQNAVAAELAAENMPVLSSSNSGGLLSKISPLIQETFQASYIIQPAYATDTDTLGSLVLQAHEDVTSYVSSQVTIPSFTPPGGSATATGQPGATKTTTQSIEDAITAFFAQISSTTTTILWVAVALIVLILILAAYGPNVGSIARAV